MKACWLVGVLVCVAGCGPRSFPIGGVRTSWAGDPVGRPGFEAGSANLHTWDGEPRFVVWADVSHNTGSSGPVGGKKAVITGEFRAAGGQGVRYSWETADGRTDPLVIDGQEYDLGRGGLFLVSLRGPETRVAQVSRDLPTLQDFDAFLERCKGDPEVQAFFGAGAARE